MDLDPRTVRDAVTKQLGYPCTYGLLDITRALKRFGSTEAAEAYIIGATERRTMDNGYYVDHRGKVIAGGAAADHIRSLEREIQKTDLHVIQQERELERLRPAT